MTNNNPAMWRAPIMWLVVGLPIAAIVASVALLVSAIRTGGADAIADRVQETGQVQVADLDPDMRAQQLGLSAVVRIQDGVFEVLPVHGSFDRAASLRLSLRHPVRAGLDRTRTLNPDQHGWRASDVLDSSHDWNVQLASEDGRWRILGRLPKGQHAALLRPAWVAQ